MKIEMIWAGSRGWLEHPGFVIVIRNMATGEDREYEDAYYPCAPIPLDRQEEDFISKGWHDYIWTEGNYACDCNRELFWRRASGEDVPAEIDTKCGHNRYRVVKVWIKGDPGSVVWEGDLSEYSTFSSAPREDPWP